jgi:hypothetical protein
VKYALGLPPFVPAPGILTPLRIENGNAVLSYRRPSTATDVTYRAEVSHDLVSWSDESVVQQRVSTDPEGLEDWEASYSGAAAGQRFFRLTIRR